MTDRSSALKPRDDPGRATAESGVVILDGPDGLAVTMTADAAALTADSLLEAVKEARKNLAAKSGRSDERPDEEEPIGDAN
jgi:hypothetical protein